FRVFMSTVDTGTMCAILVGALEKTLAHSLMIAFFLTMVLGLNESVSMQSMTLTIQALRGNTLTRRWFIENFRRELATALFLGFGCGIVVGLIVFAWRQDTRSAVVVGTTITVSLTMASLFGFSVPSILHGL